MSTLPNLALRSSCKRAPLNSVVELGSPLERAVHLDHNKHKNENLEAD